ncbi:apolipoprotein N-acyltransferase [Sphingomonas japonica]|uniref:Apolipoprotein N-acyltransferase n=1 Tax=Sphingomonas japonica TaxID=511662 RepID=A0ABX0U0Q9_9SPHN|nr:apolipoprotein N-acyltransferase [Sphingomonas japonica]NIJ22972.1 apolipoprotein N-acyltransferase [Sphingomonas japonica]
MQPPHNRPSSRPSGRVANLVCLVAGAAAATGFAPLDLWPLTLLGIATVLWLTHEAPSLKSALLRGWLFGVGHFTVNNNWIQHAFDFQDKMPPTLGYGAVVLLALYLAVYPMLAMGLAWRLASPRAVRDAATPPGGAFVLVAGAAWIATEWLRATLFTGYAWNPIGVVWLPVQGVAEIARLTGTYGLSGITIVAAGALLLIQQRRFGLAGAAFGALGAAALFGIGAAPPPPAAATLRVVQPNIGQQAALDDPDYNAAILRKMIALSISDTPGPRLVVWPEGAVNYYLESGYPDAWYARGRPEAVRASIARILDADDIALVGSTALNLAPDGSLAGAGNSIYVVGPDGRLGGRYDKAHLVPYGEYLPMRPILGELGLARLVQGDIDFLEGPGPRTLDVPGFGRVGMQICYEIIFSGEVVDRGNRPDLLFNPSNDGWFGRWGPPQHLAQARMRALEEGVPIVRSTPTGISAVIDADGRIVASIPHETSGAVEARIPRPLPPTPFSRIGNWAAAIVAALLLAGAVAIRRRGR